MPQDKYKVPFSLRHNLIIITAMVDGKEGLLLLDTGTDQLILNEKHFRGRPADEYISGIHDDMVSAQRKHVRMEISKLPAYNQYAFITDINHFEKSLDIELLGICGVDFLQEYQWVIHYHQRYIEFYPLDMDGNVLQSTSIHSPSEILPLQKEKGHLSVQVEVDGIAMNFALDTGTSSTIMNKKSKSALLSRTEKLAKIQHKSRSVGINGSRNEMTSFALSGLEIGNTEVPIIQVTFLSLRRVNQGRYWKFDGIINPLMMCHGTIGINWKKEQLYVWEPPPKPGYLFTEKKDLLADVR